MMMEQQALTNEYDIGCLFDALYLLYPKHCRINDINPGDTNKNCGADELELCFPVFGKHTTLHKNSRNKIFKETLDAFIKIQESLNSTLVLPLAQGEMKIGKISSIKLLHNTQLNDESKSKAQSLNETFDVDCLPTAGQADSSSETVLPTYNSVIPATIEAFGGIDKIIEYLQNQGFYRDQITATEMIPVRLPMTQPFSSQSQLFIPPLNNLLMNRLSHKLNLSHLYTHQIEGITAIRNGNNVIISTATASGKSLIYNIPVLESIISNESSSALYLFPTKALAQDQLRSLNELINYEIFGEKYTLPVVASICDGDTPHADRSEVKSFANIIITNPDMLHHTILSEHRNWKRVFESLRYVVIDEAHLYKGSFGCHTAMVLRRLIRVCLYHGTCPQFICCSATISNPAQHIENLIPLNFIRGLTIPSLNNGQLTVIGPDRDGSPCGERTFIVWNPPIIAKNNTEFIYEFYQNLDQNLDENSVVYSQSRAKENSAKNHMDNSHKSDKYLSSSSILFDSINHFTVDRCDRPNTLGTSNCVIKYSDSKQEELVEVKAPECVTTYVGGWKRKNKKRKFKGNEEVDSRDTNYDNDNSSSLAAIKKNSNKQVNGDQIVSKVANRSMPIIHRASAIYESSLLFTALIKQKIKTLAFCSTRKVTELVYNYSSSILRNGDNSHYEYLLPYVSSYRGGYTKQERRTIEQSLFCNELIGVISTNALELGVDIGMLDITIHLGFPGSFSSLWQQAGRSGRNGKPALSIYVCYNSPVDQYFARHPEKLFKSQIEPAFLDVNNRYILQQHLLCAAYEVPLNYSFCPHSMKSDVDLWNVSHYEEVLKHLVDDNYLSPALKTAGHESADCSSLLSKNKFLKTLWIPSSHALISCKGQLPSMNFGLRMIDPKTVSIINQSKNEEIDSIGKIIMFPKQFLFHVDYIKYLAYRQGYSRAFFELFEGAIYLHRGEQLIVKKLDLCLFKAYLSPIKANYYTSARNITSISIIKLLVSDGLFNCGNVQVKCHVSGYDKHWLGSGEVFEQCQCSLPPLEYATNACWIDLPVAIKNDLEMLGFQPVECIHAANHAILALAPVYCQCDLSDIETEHDVPGEVTEHTFRLLFYDKRVGGLGAADALYVNRIDLLEAALSLLTSCGAKSIPADIKNNNHANPNIFCDVKFGCPACIMSNRCANYNKFINKSGAVLLLDMLLKYLKMDDNLTAPIKQNDYNDLDLATGSVELNDFHNNSDAANNNNSKISTPKKSTQIQATRKSPMITPRQHARQKSLKKARFNKLDRVQQMAIQIDWTGMMPGLQ
eukprot:gene4707-6608_t